MSAALQEGGRARQALCALGSLALKALARVFHWPSCQLSFHRVTCGASTTTRTSHLRRNVADELAARAIREDKLPLVQLCLHA